MGLAPRWRRWPWLRCARSGRAAVLGTVFAGAALPMSLLVRRLGARATSRIVQRFSDFIPYLGVCDVRGVEVTDANFAVLERMAHWQAAMRDVDRHPWLGVGIGNYAAVYARYALPLWPLALGHAHNYYLNIAAETGRCGLAGLPASCGALRWWQRGGPRGGSLAGTGAWHWACWGLVHLSVHNLFDNLYVHGMYLQRGDATWAFSRHSCKIGTESPCLTTVTDTWRR